MKCGAFDGDQDSNYFDLYIYCHLYIISAFSKLSLSVLSTMDILNYILKEIWNYFKLYIVHD